MRRWFLSLGPDCTNPLAYLSVEQRRETHTVHRAVFSRYRLRLRSNGRTVAPPSSLLLKGSHAPELVPLLRAAGGPTSPLLSHFVGRRQGGGCQGSQAAEWRRHRFHSSAPRPGG